MRYEKTGNLVLTVNLHNDYSINYSIIAIGLWEHNKYHVSFYLKENNTDITILMDDMENVSFYVNYKIINSAILKYVGDGIDKGIFNKYIERYEYILQCFDRGNDLFEQERLNRKEKVRRNNNV